MLAMFSAIFGFAAPFLPELLKYFNRKADMAHEKEMMGLRLQHAEKEHLWRMEEVTAQADIEEAKELHRPAPSFGVQVLDAAKDSGWGKWAIVPAFYLFTLLDFVAGMVRPSITYGAFTFYVAYKWSLWQLAITYNATRDQALVSIWGDNDWAVLTLVLSYWFGHRASKAAFGGNATSGKAGA